MCVVSRCSKAKTPVRGASKNKSTGATRSPTGVLSENSSSLLIGDGGEEVETPTLQSPKEAVSKYDAQEEGRQGQEGRQQGQHTRRLLRADVQFQHSFDVKNIQWCPTVRPTKQEFSRPFKEYVEEMFQQHPDAACIKVVPPAGWKPRKKPIETSEVRIGSPIRQHAFGRCGTYQCILEEQRSMNGAMFESMATHPNRAAPPGYGELDGDALMERSFWSSITLNPPTYGADTPLSLFDAKVPWGWNLRKLGCLFSEYNVPEICGVTTPMTYFGMWKAFFAWHKEDLDLYSINYVHQGASKVWYCVPPSESEKFDALAKELYPDAANSCEEFMRHKDIMFSPSLLKSKGIKYVQALQKAGEFIVINAKAYHSGFNLGFNIAEAVNFALEDWLEIGRDCSLCECGALADGVSLDMSIFFPGLYDSSSASEDDSLLTIEESEEDESGSDVMSCSSLHSASSSLDTEEDAHSCKINGTSSEDDEGSFLDVEALDEDAVEVNTADSRKRRGRPPGSKNKLQRTMQVTGGRATLRHMLNVWRVASPESLADMQDQISELPREASHVTWGSLADAAPVALVTKNVINEDSTFTIVHRLQRHASRPDSAWFGVLEKDADGLYCPKAETILVQFDSAKLPKLVPVRIDWALPSNRRRGGWKLRTKVSKIVG